MDHVNFCPHCGQENQNPRLPFFAYVSELVEGFFHFDKKTWVTVNTLVTKPGLITKDYIDNKRARYTSPFKIFFFTTALWIFTLVYINSLRVHLGERAVSHESISNEFDNFPDTAKIDVSFFYGWPRAGDIPASELKELKKLPASGTGTWLAKKDLPDNYFYRLMFRAFIAKVSSSLTPHEFENKFHNYLNFFSVLLLPLSALIIFIVFYRKDLFYYDTLVLSLHNAAFNNVAFCILMWIFISYAFLTGENYVATGLLLTFIISRIYNLFSYKKVFGRSWPQTLIRSVILVIIFFLITSLAELYFLIYLI